MSEQQETPAEPVKAAPAKKATPGSTRRRPRWCAVANCGRSPATGSDRCVHHKRRKG